MGLVSPIGYVIVSAYPLEYNKLYCPYISLYTLNGYLITTLIPAKLIRQKEQDGYIIFNVTHCNFNMGNVWNPITIPDTPEYVMPPTDTYNLFAMMSELDKELGIE